MKRVPKLRVIKTEKGFEAYFVDREGWMIGKKGKLKVEKLSNTVVEAEVSGEFVVDWDVKLESYFLYMLLL